MSLNVKQAAQIAAALVLVALVAAMLVSRRQLKASRQETADAKAWALRVTKERDTALSAIKEQNTAIDRLKKVGDDAQARVLAAQAQAQTQHQRFAAISARLMVAEPPQEAGAALSWAVAEARRLQSEVK